MATTLLSWAINQGGKNEDPKLTVWPSNSVSKRYVFWISKKQQQATLQNAQPLIYISLNHKSAFCAMLLSTRSRDICKGTEMLHTFLRHWYLGAWSWTMSFSNNCCELSSEYTSSLKKKKKTRINNAHRLACLVWTCKYFLYCKALNMWASCSSRHEITLR